MRAIVAATLGVALALGGCATTPPFPAMRPLTEAHIAAMGPTQVVVDENNAGIEKSWFYTSTASAGAAYGLIGVLVTATMDAIINAGPSRRAQNAADEMQELMPVEALNASLAEQLRRQAALPEAAIAVGQAPGPAGAAPTAGETIVSESAAVMPAISAPPMGVAYADVRSVQRLVSPAPIEDAVVISARYTLSEDSSTLRVVATASYQSPQTPYTTPYTFERSVPKSETEGPAYRNTLTYYSSQLPVPTLTPELRERLIASIQDSARDESGALPAEGSDGFNAMNRELEGARDDRLTKDEISIFLTREWLRDDGALLRREIEQAHEFIAQYVLLDMNRPIAPSLTGQDELLETLTDQRTVRRIGAGTDAGSYVSSAANVTSFSTYGNTIGIARANTERINAVRQASRAEARR